MLTSKPLVRTLIIGLALFYSRPAHAYSILAHEALIDSCWASFIKPLLLSKYPDATPEDLKKAHAFAYGGAIAPDIGYFPFGKPLFTDLVHYVRSGDFVNALLDDAQDVDEYAFAVGFLCHYTADKYGHSLATNKSVPILYPKEQEKYGDVVTYEEDHLSHKRTEFAFDVLQTSEGEYKKIAYHDFIGFEISSSLLERAFPEVYGLDIHDIFPKFDLSVATLRWSFKRFFPSLTKAAWVLKKKQLRKDHPGMTRRSYIYSFRNADYYKEFGSDRRRPGLPSRIFAAFVLIVPKIGPLKVMRFKAPSPEVVRLYHQSFDTTLLHYADALRACRKGGEALPNVDFDTGNFTTPGEYGLADKNYDLLVAGLDNNNFKLMSSELKGNIIAYYSHRVTESEARNETGKELGTGTRKGTRKLSRKEERKERRAWAKTQEALQKLQLATAAAE